MNNILTDKDCLETQTFEVLATKHLMVEHAMRVCQDICLVEMLSGCTTVKQTAVVVGRLLYVYDAAFLPGTPLWAGVTGGGIQENWREVVDAGQHVTNKAVDTYNTLWDEYSFLLSLYKGNADPCADSGRTCLDHLKELRQVSEDLLVGLN